MTAKLLRCFTCRALQPWEKVITHSDVLHTREYSRQVVLACGHIMPLLAALDDARPSTP